MPTAAHIVQSGAALLKNSSNRLFVFSLVGIIVVGLSILIGIRQGWFFSDQPHTLPEMAQRKPVEPAVPRDVDHRPLTDLLGVQEDDFVESGGIQRPSRDLQSDTADLVSARAEFLTQVSNPGRAPYIPRDTNVRVAKLAQEIDDNIGKSFAKSTYYGTEPFDSEEYFKDPDAFLELTRPARVFQSAQPGPEVKGISSKTEFYQEILQGESVVLEVVATPKYPVTFHVQSLGEFDNRLKTITVAASDEGIATARYHAVSGVQGLINIMVASPGNSGQLKYMINVNLPK